MEENENIVTEVIDGVECSYIPMRFGKEPPKTPPVTYSFGIIDISTGEITGLTESKELKIDA